VTEYYSNDSGVLYNGDCRVVMATLPDNSIDAIVTDPPYELGFMGKKWDASGIAYDLEVWRQALRILKPGGHLLAFGGTRTYHRMTCAIEDAGFEIRDCLMWLYGSGFPKSLNICKAVDKLQGNVREVFENPKAKQQTEAKGGVYGDYEATTHITKGTSEWEGWGTALKPAVEPIVMARKPLTGTVAANVLEWGVGGLNIDGCRIGSRAEEPQITSAKKTGNTYGKIDSPGGKILDQGRFPANILLDEEAARMLDEQSGVLTSGAIKTGRPSGTHFSIGGEIGYRFAQYDIPADNGGASRFFYVAKAGRGERDDGCEDMDMQSGGEITNRVDGSAGLNNPRAGAGRTSGWRNAHPTVKPVELMKYLINLVSRDCQTVLDPFMGSGTTGIACELLNRKWIGIELSTEYCEIIKSRIHEASRQVTVFDMMAGGE